MMRAESWYTSFTVGCLGASGTSVMETSDDDEELYSDGHV